MAGAAGLLLELAISDEARPFAHHALPDRAECYAPVVDFLAAQRQ